SGRRLSPPLLSRRLLSRPPLFQPPCVPVRAFAFLSVRPAGVLLQGAPFPSRPRPRGGRVLLPRASCVLVPARFQDRAAAAAVFPRAAAPEEARAGAPAGAPGVRVPALAAAGVPVRVRAALGAGASR